MFLPPVGLVLSPACPHSIEKGFSFNQSGCRGRSIPTALNQSGASQGAGGGVRLILPPWQPHNDGGVCLMLERQPQSPTNPSCHTGSYPSTSRPGSGRSKEPWHIFIVPGGCFLEPGIGEMTQFPVRSVLSLLCCISSVTGAPEILQI